MIFHRLPHNSYALQICPAVTADRPYDLIKLPDLFCPLSQMLDCLPHGMPPTLLFYGPHTRHARDLCQLIQDFLGHRRFHIHQGVGVPAAALIGQVGDIDPCISQGVGHLADHLGDVLMGDGYTPCDHADAHVAFRKVYRVLDVSVLHEIPQFFHGHHGAVF